MAAEFTSWRYVYPLCKKAIRFTRRVRFHVLISCIEESVAGWVVVGVGRDRCRHGRRSASGSKVGSKMILYMKMFDSLPSTIFKLVRKMTGNSINVVFFKFVIYVRGGRCDCSPRAPANPPTPLEND